MKNIGKFKILEEIGRGGIGIVYKALDPLIDREVAIKVIIEQELGLPELKERFYREARSAGKLSHENITIVYEVGEFDDSSTTFSGHEALAWFNHIFPTA